MTTVLAPPERLGIGAQPAGSPDLATHVAAHGPLVLPRDHRGSTALHHVVAESGLLGRGGAGFPSAAKWEAVRRGVRRPVVVVNALEGEPASAKDRVLLWRTPHLVLDGADAVAAALRASEIVVCVGDDSRGIVAPVEAAVEERRRAGVSPRRISVRCVPARYVAGEESALADWLSGGPGLPVMRTDKSVPLRSGGRPVLVHNAETLAHVALIARHGPEWFRRAGTPEAPGSALVTVTGAPSGTVVMEVELGTPVGDILVQAGVPGPPSAVLLGGYGGTWADASVLGTPYAPGPLSSMGASMGVGIVVGLPAGACGIAETARIARYLAGESAGQCGPCVFGLPAIADDLERLWTGRADRQVLDRIAARVAAVDGRGACRHPDGAARLVRSALAVFGEDARAHAQGRPCAGARSPSVLPFPADAGAVRSAS